MGIWQEEKVNFLCLFFFSSMKVLGISFFSRNKLELELKGGLFMKFTKMHGIGNDYIYLYEEKGVNFPLFAEIFSKHHTGIGSDGVIHILPSKSCDFAMEMYNADGSMGKMCGNGIRCVGKYLYDNKKTSKTALNIETAAGPRSLKLTVGKEDTVTEVSVNMGKAENIEKYHIQVSDLEFSGTFVSVGNPHFVIECDDIEEIPVEIWGKAIEKHPKFAEEGVNVEFCTRTEDGFRFRVWERGSGETQACGTGACACFAVLKEEGKLKDTITTAYLLGGSLQLWEEQGEIQMRGSATMVFQGEIEEKDCPFLV